MPIYEYRCRACGETVERLRPVASADDPVDCACGRRDAVRLPSRPARPRRSGSALPVASGPSVGAAGGCCGGACACGH